MYSILENPLNSSYSPIFRAQEIKLIEQQVAARPDAPALMEKAGLAAAELARKLLQDKPAILIIAGPGNNGGDALVAARYLKSWWYNVTVVFTGTVTALPPEAAAALLSWQASGGTICSEIPAHTQWDLIIDGLFGTGLARDLTGSCLALVKQINQMNVPVLALDIPSGLDSDTGQPFKAAIRATHTLAFIAYKPGLFTAYGPDYCGNVHLATLDISSEYLASAKGLLLGWQAVAAPLKPRPQNSHKGMLGSVGIVGGAQSMTGAALLAARAALKCGAGRVYAGMLDSAAPTLDMLQPELMLRTPEHLFEENSLSCLVIGPGLGQSDTALHWLRQALASDLPLILDADALNLIAIHADIAEQLKARKAASILTPHPAEAGRLLNCSNHEIQQDRIGSALVIASRFNSMVVLKGAGSICALPDDHWYINPTGNPGLSSAGMGDVLCGMIGALIAQRMNPEKAMLLSVFLHGAAADSLVIQGTGPIGLTASEVTDEARKLLNQWVYPATACLHASRQAGKIDM